MGLVRLACFDRHAVSCREGLRRMVTEARETRLTGLLLALTLGVLGWTSRHGDSMCAKGFEGLCANQRAWDTRGRGRSVSFRDFASTGDSADRTNLCGAELGWQPCIKTYL